MTFKQVFEPAVYFFFAKFLVKDLLRPYAKLCLSSWFIILEVKDIIAPLYYRILTITPNIGEIALKSPPKSLKKSKKP